MCGGQCPSCSYRTWITIVTSSTWFDEVGPLKPLIGSDWTFLHKIPTVDFVPNLSQSECVEGTVGVIKQMVPRRYIHMQVKNYTRWANLNLLAFMLYSCFGCEWMVLSSLQDKVSCVCVELMAVRVGGQDRVCLIERTRPAKTAASKKSLIITYRRTKCQTKQLPGFQLRRARGGVTYSFLNNNLSSPFISLFPRFPHFSRLSRGVWEIVQSPVRCLLWPWDLLLGPGLEKGPAHLNKPSEVVITRPLLCGYYCIS